MFLQLQCTIFFYEESSKINNRSMKQYTLFHFKVTNNQLYESLLNDNTHKLPIFLTINHRGGRNKYNS
jgi:hypothetical protein